MRFTATMMRASLHKVYPSWPSVPVFSEDCQDHKTKWWLRIVAGNRRRETVELSSKLHNNVLTHACFDIPVLNIW